MRPTPEQAEAIARRSGPLLLEATAGSGKTSVLVERFVAMVVDDAVEPRRVLAITFTEKAAGELRERVRAELVARGRREAARETETAAISTIHAFCAALLRWAPVAAGLDPGFVVLDEGAAREVRQGAFETAFAGWLAGDGERARAALDLAAAWGPDRLRRAVVALHDERRSAGEAVPSLPVPDPVASPDPAALRAACAGAMQELGTIDAPGDRVRRALGQVERCSELLQEEGVAAGGPTAALALFDDAPPARSSPSIARLDAAIVRPGNNGVLRGEGLQAYGEALAAFRAALVEHRGADDLALLGDLLARHTAAYAEAKRARGALDFADLEVGARDLLRDRPGLRAAVRARYERVMVDEFQDTNPLQLELLDLVAPEHLFAVGDEFQSIYGFRHADVEGFRRRRTSLGGRDAVRTLTRNFRSRAGVLGAVNAAFSELLGEDFVELVPGREDAGDPGDGPPVELLLTDAQAWEEHEERLGDTLPPVAACRRAEARLVAQRVRDLVEGEGVEPAEVVVLVRATASLEVFERALEDQGLATYASGGRGYWSAQQVLDLRAWLQALANPEEEAALYGVLASPLVGVGADTLARLAMTRRALGWGLWRTVEAAFGAQASVRGDEGGALCALCAAVAPGEGGRLAAFASRFATERRLASRLGLDALVERVVTATGYDLSVLALPGGERRMANVHKLVRLAAAYEAAHGRDLAGFLAFAAAEEEAGAREPEAPIELGDLRAVRLMTIHAAKGLEFATVVLADLGRRPPAPRPDLAVGDGVAGVRVIGFEGRGAPTAALERLTEGALERAGAEERRVLYVGATRARDRLILSGSLRLDRPPPQGPVAPPLAWLAPALVPALAAGPGGPAVELHDEVRDGQRVGVAVLRNTPETVGTVLREESLTPGAERATPQPGAFAAVCPGGGPSHPAGACGAPAPPMSPALPALSHSALARYRACGYRFYLERVLGLSPVEPPSMPPEQPGQGGLDPRVRGILVHELLQRLDLAAPAPVEPAELRTPEGVRLSRAQVDEVVAPVAAFARSALRARLAAARTVRREVPFALPLGDGPLLTGVVDALADEDGSRALVVDYKTDRLNSDEDPAGRVAGAYAAQRAAYALAALREGFATVEVAYAFLERPAEPVQARFTTADAPALEAELLAAAAPLLRGEFAVTEGPHRDLCAACPGRGGLCPHPDERTLRRGA